MLCLRLELLTGRYVACAFNDRDRVEWPPHPARVFSALVAALHDGEPLEAERAALRWLESLPPPALHHSPASVRDAKVFYVPVNDKALTDKATVSNAWARVLDPALPPKARAKAEARLADAYEKAGATEATRPKKVREIVDHLLPHSRTKQPRAFPSATPHDPAVWLCWDAEPEPSVRAGLEALLRRLVRLGHSSSMVAARLVDDAPAPALRPDPEGPERLRWVGPGQLAALEALHAAAPYSEQRVMPYVVARYRHAEARTEPARSSFAADFLVLRRVDGPRLPVLATERVADAVRRALMAHAEDPRAPLLSGHAPDGAPLQDDHLAVVPLPFVGARHATGDLLGVALVPPAGLSRGQLRPLHAALARWEAAGGEPRGQDPRCVLNLGRLGRWTLERSLEPSPLHNLREPAWTRLDRRWVSVTPVLLDRHPGSLGDPKPSARRRAVRRADEIISAACERIGLPAPERIELSLDPPLRGTEPAPRFEACRRDPADRRPLLHLRLTFPRPVGGPVLLGAGRYRGLGLLRPMGGEAP